MLRVILVLASLAAIAYSQTASTTTINAAGCGTTGSSAREEDLDPSKIVGGIEATPYLWRWQISLSKNGGGHFCGGSLINSQWVLTAAHCTIGQTVSSLRVRVGSHQHSTGGTLLTVSKVIQHASYSSSTYNNDISLLKLSSPVTFTTRIGPTCIIAADTTTASLAGKSAIVTGWGVTSSGGSTLPTNLRQVAVSVTTDATCRNAYQSGFIASTMICAADSGKDSCQGDSGGPLVLKRATSNVYDQIGVVSWGYGCALAGYPGVYTRLANYVSWISDNVRNG